MRCFFTSGGTESNNMVLKRAVIDLGVRHIISSQIEHSCVLNTIKYLAHQYAVQVDYVPVDDKGHIDMVVFERLLQENGDKETLVSLMHANNELGTIIVFRPSRKILSRL